MEWFWYIIAALGAGVGTGLVGLSAATVMVPMLIVLCPSFAGETGAYQATAVALASDILGSAVATYTYAKHKNIDLKRGWLIMAIIIRKESHLHKKRHPRGWRFFISFHDYKNISTSPLRAYISSSSC